MPSPEKKQIYYVRESAVQSIISDIVSVGFLVGVLTLNYKVWNGDWYVTVFLLFMWLIFISGKANRRIKRFNTDQELISYLQSQ